MAVFRYKARGGRGDLLQGTVEAASAEAVAAQLLNGGVTPLDITEESASGGDVLQLLRGVVGPRRPQLAELILFSRQMYTLTRAGVPIIRGMRGLAQSTRSAALRDALEAVTTNLESGRDLSSSLAQHPGVFSHLVQSMVRVGEESGRLEETFQSIARHLQTEKDTRDRIKTAFRYPTLVLVAVAVAIAVINVLVIPAFATVFERSQVELPWATRALLGISEQFVAYWPAGLLGIVLGGLGLRIYLATEAGTYRWDKAKLALPVVGSIVHRATLARFGRGLSLALRSGVPLTQALTVVSRAVDNEFLGDRILQIRNGIERGDTLTRSAAATDMFTPLVLQMMAVGEETGAVDQLLDEVADFYEREVDYALKNLSTALEPLLIVAVGVMVLILALAVFLPMWDLSAGMGMR